MNVTFEDASATGPERVFVSVTSQLGMGGGSAAMRDGRLSLEVVPGRTSLSSPAACRRSHGSAKRLTSIGAARSRMMTDELTAEPGGRIDITFTSRSSTVTGGVTDDGGKPVADYTVFIVPGRRRGAAAATRTPPANTDGDARRARPLPV